MSAVKPSLFFRVRAFVSDPNPILVKELRATLRTNLFVRFLYLSTGLVGLLVLVTGAAVASGDMSPATVGQLVFQLFFGTTLLILSLVAPGYASAAITAEHEQETWESLLLSGMSPWRIVVGKFVACYAAIALVLVAFSPVVGVAFLFGGISPGQVWFGFLSMLVALAPAVAFGVALSARLRSTRLSIVLATFIWVPIAMVGTTFLGFLGEAARSEWSLGTEGPFFYTEALANRLDHADTWVLLVALPIYVFGMPVWFLLASAVAGVRSPAEDRSTALKLWAIALLVSSLLVGVLMVSLTATYDDASTMAMAAESVGAFFAICLGLVFANEPPLPPRPLEIKRASFPLWKKAILIFGPGAAGTLRFAMASVIILSIGGAVIMGGLSALVYERARSDYLEALAALSLGAAAVACFTASFATWLRLSLRNGIAARVLAVTVLTVASVVPFLLYAASSPDELDNLEMRAPFFLHFTPIFPAILAAERMNHEASWRQIPMPVLVWGTLALIFWVLVEIRVRAARKRLEKRRAEQAAP